MTELQALSGVASRDPFLLYTTLAAALLGLVSLVSGWLRADLLAVLRPRGLLSVVLAVLAAFALLWLSQALVPAGAPGWLGARGLSRFPLYVAALAYGPSAGLLSALLFAAFAAQSSLPGLSEAVLALELMVLGWFAISPSPRRHRWAGPLGAALAYLLTWATGGSAMLQYLTGSGTSWATQWSYHQNEALGVLASCLLLFALGPCAYQRLFPGSRIAGAEAPCRTEAEAGSSPSAHAEREAGRAREHPRQALTSAALEAWGTRERRRPSRHLTPPPLSAPPERGRRG